MVIALIVGAIAWTIIVGVIGLFFFDWSNIDLKESTDIVRSTLFQFFIVNFFIGGLLTLLLLIMYTTRSDYEHETYVGNFSLADMFFVKWSLILGVIVQLLFVFILMKRIGFEIPLKDSLTPRIIAGFISGLLGGAVISYWPMKIVKFIYGGGY
jgi:hypothetical protein